MGQVAIDARSHPVMTRLQPGIVLRLHDVTVGARRRIVTEVGEPLGVPEGECTDPDGDSREDRDQ
jgi:hypothetical protein